MTKPTKASERREGFHTVIPYLTVEKPAELIDFVKQSFNATENLRTTGSAGGMHAEVKIGDSIAMIGGAAHIAPQPAAIHLYIPDVDEAYRRAMSAGAISMFDPADQPYGERSGAVQDPTGNRWYIATTFVPLHEIHPDMHTVTVYFHPIGAPQFIEFLVNAFGAEEVMRHEVGEGFIAHAKVRIGDSVIEMGEARGISQPIPPAIYLLVEDVEATYAQALKAGATSIGKSWVKDPFDNVWYLNQRL